MGRNLAISIGINKYDFLTPLKYAKRDAELMQEFLERASFEQVFFFSDDSPDFQGRPTRPSRNNLRRFLRQISNKPIMATGDNLWFFFSGHGMQYDGRDYLMPCDGDAEDVEHTAIPIDFVTECLRGCGAGNVILLLDACRYRGSKSGLGIGNQAAEIARQKGVVTFFSCSPNQLSYEIETLQQGIFTKAVLEGLGIQGKCATVERLNHYLSCRVPELIREHKGEKVRQTPYCIAEPVTKSHLIICPQYATLQDVSILKNDAYQAELNKDYGLAKQLWIRVLGASTGDMEAINGIQRIAISQIENERYSQSSSISSNVANKSGSPLSPKSTPVTNTTPTEPDLPLKSDRGIDYTNLRDLLAAKKWKEADEETARVMLKVAGREKEEWLDTEHIDKFPCEDLRTIDRLWVKYSNGRFGFLVQNRIYQSLGGTREKDSEVWEKFCDRVGWRKKNEWLYYKDLTFSEKAPEAHLPVGGDQGLGWRGHGNELFSRVETCRLQHLSVSGFHKDL
ncbi:MAG: GUN4 domain-containing protein [Microcoleus sp. PH2017_15_JOR_U_A]|uniref:GUN4 domain-containing protein n=1 Tax=unclassified Microcoleus TaxID=2642155 RepID=UPI001D7A021A|nr:MULTISPECIES: GUN4 domain-containing protein [unclassified Microcoleus]MCC3476216.1 GUN4 domain-containing protein [Microcoleus sp. PH2017_13_LAR_U_A]MCC3488697.1 GUN4 domain-containing protein [Microcoleus sp. PH2017_14_LAR_D_A]MCC3501215.1 GUN4 domain-containing protein [Microcoleus sp. PH2017_15_JOR_U_A]MCC3569986.1 GUN4 domain-containing protein [Microcoleus sp. PH2017_31_RDM_U_A]MCC3582441.1 GUN4 domain-containing protein [Microcoleus sp. PH2017_32_RDM_D_A]